MFWRLGRGRTQLSKPGWLQKPGRREQIGTEERRSENIYGRNGGTKVSNDHSTLHVKSILSLFQKHREPHICLLPLFGHHHDYKSQGNTLWSPDSLQLWWENTHVYLAIKETNFPPWDWPHLHSDTSSIPFSHFIIQELNFWAPLSRYVRPLPWGKNINTFRKFFSPSD